MHFVIYKHSLSYQYLKVFFKCFSTFNEGFLLGFIFAYLFNVLSLKSPTNVCKTIRGNK